jgi:hypothetical protein
MVVFIVIVNVTEFPLPSAGSVSGEPLALHPMQRYRIPVEPETGVATLAVIEVFSVYGHIPGGGSGVPY